jgi:hypothetical protein
MFPHSAAGAEGVDGTKVRRTNSFFFVSTDITGSFAARNALACVLIY